MALNDIFCNELSFTKGCVYELKYVPIGSIVRFNDRDVYCYYKKETSKHKNSKHRYCFINEYGELCESYNRTLQCLVVRDERVIQIFNQIIKDIPNEHE